MENNDIYAKPKLPKYIRIPKIKIVEGGSHVYAPYIPSIFYKPKNQFKEFLEFLDVRGYSISKEAWKLYNIEELCTDMKTICGIDPLEDLFIILREEGRLEKKLDYLKLIKEVI